MKHQKRIAITILVAASLFFVLVPLQEVLATYQFNVVERVSVASDGSQGYAMTTQPDINQDGRYVVWEGVDSNIVPGDTNGVYDIFYHDRETNTTLIVSTDSSGALGTADAESAQISDDGMFVVFNSEDTSLSPLDGNSMTDVYRKDITTGNTTLVSTDAAGVIGNGNSSLPDASSDGSLVVFQSSSSNLTADVVSGTSQIFMKDLTTGVVTLVSKTDADVVGNSDSAAPTLSPDGRYVVFQSGASNLISGGSNGLQQIFVKDMLTGAIDLVSKHTDGTQSNANCFDPHISDDGRFVTFTSFASNLITGGANSNEHVYLHDRTTGTTTLLSKSDAGLFANSSCYDTDISGDGRFVIFYSYASNLVPDDTNGKYDIFAVDTTDSTITRISVNTAGVEGNGWSYYSAISGDGKVVTYRSDASNLVDGDTNATYDIFVAEANFTLTVPELVSPADAATVYDKTPAFDWSDVSVAVGYTLQYGPDNTFATYTEETTVDSTFTPSADLAVGTWYWRVNATDGSTTSDWSATRSFTVAELAAPALTAPADAATIDDATPAFDWEDVSGATGYTLEYSTDNTFASPTQELVTESTFTPSTDLANGIWYWRVKATNADAESVWSAVWSFTVEVFAAPTLVAPADASSSYLEHQPNFDWEDVSGATGYVLQYCSDETFSAPVEETTVDSTFTPAAAFSTGTRYWRVKSTAVGKESAWSAVWSFTIANAPAPVQIAPENGGMAGNIDTTYTWNVVDGADRYRLEVSETDGTILHSARYAASVKCVDTVCSVDVAGPLAYSQYRWRVQAYVGDWAGDWSDYNTFTTTLPQVELRSPGVDAIIYGGRPTFIWYQVADAASYIIEFYDATGTEDVLIMSWQKNPVCDPYCTFRIPTDMDLGANYGDYKWRIFAKNGVLEGAWSETRTFTYTPLDRTWQISPETDFEVTSSPITFKWGEITGATMYLFQIRENTIDEDLIGNYLVEDALYCVDGGECTWTFVADSGVFTEGMTYKWHVRAKNGRNYGRWTAYRTFTINLE